MKTYKAIIFDWDGTAVPTRAAPVDVVLPLMVQLLEKGILLNIISGTTYEKIADGSLHDGIPIPARANLYLGLGRGAFNYGFDPEGSPVILENAVPESADELLRIHEAAFRVHTHLLREFGYETDIVFSRPNYCKIDLLVNLNRGDALFLQPGEIDSVNRELARHGLEGGMQALIRRVLDLTKDLHPGLQVTTDAKYLELGLTTKADNVRFFLDSIAFPRGLTAEDCCFWGDEFTYLDEGVPGSDALMMIDSSRAADFFDVSPSPRRLPYGVQSTGGGVPDFIRFLESQL
jgi:hypothetical protein